MNESCHEPCPGCLQNGCRIRRASLITDKNDGKKRKALWSNHNQPSSPHVFEKRTAPIFIQERSRRFPRYPVPERDGLDMYLQKLCILGSEISIINIIFFWCVCEIGTRSYWRNCKIRIRVDYCIWGKRKWKRSVAVEIEGRRDRRRGWR
jgi:hypothetical protein